jgi:hypothetical protein
MYQTAIFVGMKFLDPSNIMSLLGSFMSNATQKAGAGAGEKADGKSSMKGPSINPDDI